MEDLSSVAELAKRRPLDSALDRIFEITEIDSDCNLSETLANKFGKRFGNEIMNEVRMRSFTGESSDGGLYSKSVQF